VAIANAEDSARRSNTGFGGNRLHTFGKTEDGPDRIRPWRKSLRKGIIPVLERRDFAEQNTFGSPQTAGDRWVTWLAEVDDAEARHGDNLSLQTDYGRMACVGKSGVGA